MPQYADSKSEGHVIVFLFLFYYSIDDVAKHDGMNTQVACSTLALPTYCKYD